MSQPRRGRRPALESLEARLVMSTATGAAHPAAAQRHAGAAAPAAQVGGAVPGDVTGDGVANAADLQAFAKAFTSHIGDAYYNPAIDFGHTGFISQQDGKFIERRLTNPPPARPLKVYLRLPPGEQILGHHPSNSGGATYDQDVTIIGRTTPYAIVFADSGQGNFTFDGKAIIADQNGFFTDPVRNVDGINNFEFLAYDSRGQQTIRAFPIIWIKAFYSRHFHYRTGTPVGGIQPTTGNAGTTSGGTSTTGGGTGTTSNF